MESQELPANEPAPEFSGGSFNITYFAPAEGFQMQTVRSLRRRDNLTEPFPAQQLHAGNKAEYRFQDEQNKKAEARGEERGVNPMLAPDFKVKVNILNMRKVGRRILVDTKPSTFVAYNDDENVGSSKPENTWMREELGTQFAVGLIVVTTEPNNGTSKMIVQHRSANNRTYRDQIGASAAGYADQEINGPHEDHPGTLKPVNTDYVIRMAETELEEEVGIDPEFMEDIKITAIVKELIKIHYEATLLGKTTLSAKQVEKLATEKKQVERGAFDFSEDFFVLDATPETIETLLTKVKNPIPPTHMAAFVATGRILMLQRSGEEAAREWTERMEIEVRRNINEIDQIVSTATEGAEKGYNFRKTPSEQGLPDIESELKRTGLV